MTMNTTPKDLFEKLDSLRIKHATVSHPPLHTVEDSRAMRGTLPGGHAKNLFLKNKKGEFWLLVAEEDAPVHLKAFSKAVGAGNLSFANSNLLMDRLGVLPGAVTPFALINAPAGSISVYFDKKLLASDPLNFHPLNNTMTTTIAKSDLLIFLDALGHEISEIDLETLN